MKKLMISTIILLPLIVLAIMLVSGAIMSLITHIYVESVEFVENDTLVLVMDDEAAPPQSRLEVNVLPLKAGSRDIVFTVEDGDIASVDKDGVVTAKFYGETYVTVSSVENAAASARRKVLVTSRDVHAIKLKDYSAEMYRGESQRLLAEVFPAEASNKNIVWTSSDEAVLSVTQSGIVTCNGAGKGDGIVTVTATSDDSPTVKAVAAIRCCEPLVSISANDAPVSTAREREQFPSIVPYPANAAYTVAYTSSAPDVATVDAQGAITFRTWGHVTITATARDGREHASSVSVEYDSTYGYFMGPLFGTKGEGYVFDYDAVLAAGGALDISFVKTPESSHRLIREVTFDGPDLLEYNDATETFTLKNVGDETKLGTVTVTVHATKYDRASGALKEYDNDVCTVEIVRSTSSLSFVANGEPRSEISVTVKSVNLSEIIGDGMGGIGVRATPANHTDKISYALEGENGCASLAGAMLTFSEEGTVTVAVTASGASSKLKVSYTRAGLSDKTVTLGEGDPAQSVSLSFEDEGNCENGILEFAAPEGYTAKISSDNSGVVSVEGKKLVPHKGGFAKISVTFEAAAPEVALRSVPAGYTVDIYVDRPVEPANITFSVEGTPLGQDEFATSKKRATLTVTLLAEDGAMEGKELFLDGKKVEEWTQAAGSSLVCSKTVEFSGTQPVSVTASVQYAARATACDPAKTGECARNNCTLRSTDGKLTEGLTVKLGETVFAASGNELTFSNIGEEKTLTLEVKNPDPADFVLSEGDISFAEGEGVWFEAETQMGDNAATLKLTSAAGTYGVQTVVLTVAGHTFEISLNVLAPADSAEIKYGDAPLTGGETYTTFLSELSFTVTLSRRDGKNVTDACKKLTATLGGQSCTVQQNGENSTTFTVKAAPVAAQQTLELAAEGGLATLSVGLQKLDIAACEFTYHIEYSYNGAEHKELAETPILVGEENKYFFPRGLGTFEIRISPKSENNRLGGFEGEPEQEEEKHFSVAEKEWAYAFHTQGNLCYLEVTVPKDKTFFSDEKLTFKCPAGTATLTLTCPNVTFVEMAGFDSGDKGNGGDIYKGYQQVRVFAKRSDYGDGNVVDYFRVPFEVQSEIENVTDPVYAVWNLSRHNDKSGEISLITTQHGTELMYGGESYTIVEMKGEDGAPLPSKLVKGTEVIAQGGKYEAGAVQVPWVDVFAEEGYAHIYFGNFGGLSEVDVQNDYFGNFGEKEGWAFTPQTVLDAAKEGSGRNFTPSANAYSYLRVAVGDGTVDGTSSTMNDKSSGANIHFNFNVLQDANLVNVFNASGYYKNSNIVLHDNLYGVGELGTEGEPYNEATEKGLFLENKDGLGKTLIYGNGYQVNFEAMNASLVKAADKGTSNGVSVQKAYNATIKASTPTETVKKYEHVVVLKMQYAYYCDVEYYSKISPWGANASTPGYVYLKNTALRCAAQSAMQLYYSTSTAYIENVVLNECVGGFVSDSQDGKYDVVYNFKGFVDVLNYMSFSGLASSINQQIGMMAELGFDAEIKNNEQYLEWFGKTPDAITSISSGSEPWLTRRLFNVFLYNRFTSSQGSTLTIKYWDKDAQQYQTKEEGGAFDNGVGLATPIDQEAVMMGFIKMGYYRVFVYDTSVALDGGQKTGDSQYYNSRNMNDLFSESRYIRLLCQYKSLGSDGKTPEKNFEHILWHTNAIYRDYSIIGRREGHIENLKNSLVGVEWPDGTSAADAGVTAAVQMNALLSETVLPSRRPY